MEVETAVTEMPADASAFLEHVYDAALGAGHWNAMRQALATPPRDTTLSSRGLVPPAQLVAQLAEHIHSTKGITTHELMDDVILVRGRGMEQKKLRDLSVLSS